MEMIQVVFLTVLVFFVLVTIHEWGHFYFAKRAGILVREFAIGFGPKVFSYRKNETRYTLRLLPFGGFVRMAGEDPELIEIQPGQTIAVRMSEDQVTHLYLDQLDQRKNVVRGIVEEIDIEEHLFVTLDVDGDLQTLAIHPQAMMVTKGQETQIAPLNRQFGSKTVGQRAMSIFAGPLMNFFLAFVLFAAYILMVGVPEENPTHLQIAQITAGKPADRAGLKPGDIIDSINGTDIGTDSKRMIEMIGKSTNKPMNWTITRDGQSMKFVVTPELIEGQEGGKVGIVPVTPMRSASFVDTIKYSGIAMKNTTVQIFEGFRMLVLGQFKLDDLGGPVRTFEVTGQIAKQGIEQLTSWAAILSLYLGIFNLLPIPALDGSRLVFLGIEAVRGRKIDPNRESMVHIIGFAMLMLLMLAVTYNDILRLVKG